MNKNFRNVAIHKSAHDEARFLADIQDRSMASVMEELIDRVFQIAMSYEKEGVSIDYETCLTDSTLLISVRGKNRLICESQKVNEKPTKPLVVDLRKKKGKVS